MTKSFYALLSKKEKNIVTKGETVIFDSSHPEQAVRELEEYRQQGKDGIQIIDLAIMADDRPWAFVRDTINRSGTNPLRLLSGLSTTRFIDLGQLYVVPGGQEGITILSLGARFKEVKGGRKASCGHLHTIAIIAHAMNFKVSAIVVSAKNKTKFLLAKL